MGISDGSDEKNWEKQRLEKLWYYTYEDKGEGVEVITPGVRVPSPRKWGEKQTETLNIK